MRLLSHEVVENISLETFDGSNFDPGVFEHNVCCVKIVISKKGIDFDSASH